jgi:hypothetical protein
MTTIILIAIIMIVCILIAELNIYLKQKQKEWRK